MAANISVARVQTSDRNINQLQSNITQAISQLNQQPLIGGVMLTAQALNSGGNNPISHNLGYTPSFFIVTNQNANSNVWATSFTSTLINLSCSANCTISLWVM